MHPRILHKTALPFLIVLLLPLAMSMCISESQTRQVDLAHLRGRILWHNGPDVTIEDLVTTFNGLAQGEDPSFYLVSAEIKGKMDNKRCTLDIAEIAYAAPYSPRSGESMMHPNFEWTRYLIFTVGVYNGKLYMANLTFYGGERRGGLGDFDTYPCVPAIQSNVTVTQLEQEISSRVDSPTPPTYYDIIVSIPHSSYPDYYVGLMGSTPRSLVTDIRIPLATSGWRSMSSQAR